MKMAMNCVEMAEHLANMLRQMKTRHGDKWPEVSRGWREVLKEESRMKGCNAVQAALPIAKAMRAEGLEPFVLLATAAEICGEDK